MSQKGKLYYTIGEVAEKLNISKSVIRYWENEFSFIKPHRNNRGERKFTTQTISELRIVHHLVKDKGFTISGAKKELENNKEYRLKIERTIVALETAKLGLQRLLEKVDK